jgi:hypothetical protein
MKAHRRNGIPTLMLQEGGAPSTRSGGLASGYGAGIEVSRQL